MSLDNTAKSLAQDSDDSINEALARVLASALFADVPRLSRFLEFVVTETQSGRGDRLKGFTIACEVFDKNDPSDAQTTTIVRVEAGRLRRRLADYYGSEGSADPLRISIPKGGYRPVFEPSDVSKKKDAETGQKLIETSSRKDITGQGFIQRNAVALCLAVIVASFSMGITYCSGTGSDGSPVAAAPAVVYTTPTIAILPLEAFDSNQPQAGLGLAITESLIVALSKQPGLHVMALSSSDYFRSRVVSVKDIGREMQVSHVLKGGYSGGGNNLQISIALHDALSGYVTWSDDIETENVVEASAIIDRINRGISRQLGLDAPATVQPPASFDQDKYALFVQARNLTHPPGNKLRVTLALGIFDTLINAYPDFAEGYGGAAYAHSARVWWRHSEDTQDDTRRARDNAQRALALDSNVGLAYLAQGLLEMADGKREEAVAYLQQAVDAQPSNSLALSVLAIFKLWNDEDFESSVHLAEQAIRLDPLSPRTPYWNILGVIQFHLGNYEEAITALQTNLARGGPRPPYPIYYLAASLAATGRTEEARGLLGDLNVDNDTGQWQHWIYRNFKNKAQFNELLSMLEPLGVSRSANLGRD